jgi:superfamily II DNA/RNA helicase
MRLGRAGLVGAAISFARSERGKRMIRDARNRVDTPANRDKVKQTVSGLRARRSSGDGRGTPPV